MVTKFKKWVCENNPVLIFISIYFLISIIKIEHPGVNNDQLMFVNAATLNPDNMFLWKSFHGIPIMVFPYIGALKSYLYMPIFHIFGVNIWSIRLPQIITICISWFILYKTLLLSFNKKIALLTILFLSLNPSIIVYSKVDQGPTVLEFFFKILAVYLLFLYLKTKKSIFYFSIFPVLALGIFNKLNFIWFVNAFLISFIIFYGRAFYKDFKRFDKLLPFLLIGIPYFFLIKLFMKISREIALSYKNFVNVINLSNVSNNFIIFQKNLTEIINGNIFFNVVYGYNPTPLGTYFSIMILLILFIGGYLIILQKALKAYYFFISIVIITIVQLLLTKQAISAWHVLSIFPFFIIILAAGITRKNFFIFLAGLIIFYQLAINFLYIAKYGSPTKSIAYSSKIYDLVNFAKQRNEKFICLDVDICNQLLSFNQEVGKYKEPFGYLDPDTYNYSFIKLGSNFENPDGFLYIAHSDTNSHFPDLKKRFFKYLKDSKINFIKVKEFKDGENIAFEVFKIGNF